MLAAFRVFSYEFRRNVVRKSYLFISIGLPILAVIAFFGIRAFVAYQQSQPAAQDATKLQDSLLPIGIIDQAHLLPPKLNGNITIFPSEDEAKNALSSNAISSYWIIPEDYVQTGDIRLYID